MGLYITITPVRYVDPTGELVWPGEIHNAVSNHILWSQLVENGRLMQPNKFVKYEGLRFGFADLYDAKTGEVWEIKPKKDKYYMSGSIQLQKYINHIEGASAGRSIGNESFYYFTLGKLSATPSIFKVNYTSDDYGMIYYSYDPVVDGDAIAVALALLAVAFYTGTYNGSTIPIPSFG